MGKIIYPNNEVWAWGGERDKPSDAERFELGNESGIQAKPPKHSDHNFQMHRADQNIQTILRYGITQYSTEENYPLHARCMSGAADYISITDNNVGNPTSDTAFWMPYINPAQYIVGSVLEFAHSKAPMEIGYPGQWQSVETGVTTISASPDSASVIGTVTGNNSQTVPVPKHKHNNTVSNNISADQAAHLHHSGNPVKISVIANYGRVNVGAVGEPSEGTTSHTNSCVNTSATKPGITIHGGVSITNNDHGIDNATINVTGRGINLVKWIRTS